MIPVPGTEIIRLNIEEVADEKYKNLLRDQAKIIMMNHKKIKAKAKLLYSIVNSGANEKLISRCSKYKLLEIKCCEYSLVIADGKIDVEVAFELDKQINDEN